MTSLGFRSCCEIGFREAGKWWVRFTGNDGIYRWLHPDGTWVEEPNQINMPDYPSRFAAESALARATPMPPELWTEKDE